MSIFSKLLEQGVDLSPFPHAVIAEAAQTGFARQLIESRPALEFVASKYSRVGRVIDNPSAFPGEKVHLRSCDLLNEPCVSAAWKDVVRHYLGMAEIGKQDKRIVYSINKLNLGLFANYNACIEKAQGQFIKPFAQDDLLHPSYLEKCLAVFQAEPSVALLSCQRLSIDSSGQLLHADELPCAKDVFVCDQVVSGLTVIKKCLFPLTNYIGEPSTVMFRRSHTLTGFDAQFYHIGDLEYWLRILQDGDYYFLSETLCNFRRHEKSTTLANARGLLDGVDLVRLTKKLSAVFQSLGETEESFLRSSLPAYASYLLAQVEYGTVSGARLAAGDDLPVASELFSGNPGRQNELLVGFRELAFHALKQLAAGNGHRHISVEKAREISKNQMMIKVLEAEVRLLVESPSWRKTRYLRELSRMLALSEDTVDEPQLEFDQSGDILQQQMLYIEYLKKSIVRIKNSRSLKVARVLRTGK
jgi:hypothetical protein